MIRGDENFLKTNIKVSLEDYGQSIWDSDSKWPSDFPKTSPLQKKAMAFANRESDNSSQKSIKVETRIKIPPKLEILDDSRYKIADEFEALESSSSFESKIIKKILENDNIDNSTKEVYVEKEVDVPKKLNFNISDSKVQIEKFQEEAARFLGIEIDIILNRI